MRKFNHVYLILFILAIPVVGYGMMHLMVYLFPMDADSTLRHFFVTATIIVLGLGVPYLLLKLGMFEAHLNSPGEKSLHLSDIPKDQGQLVRDDNR